MNSRFLPVLLLLASVGCPLIPDDETERPEAANRRPTVAIISGAASSDSAGVDYRVNFAWLGTDTDGVIDRFQYAIDDTSVADAWIDTTISNIHINFSAGEPGGYDTPDTMSEWHSFHVRAIDNEGAVSLPDGRHFNARTIAPVTRITFPPLDWSSWVFERDLHIEWEGEDIDSASPDGRPAFYEYKLIQVGTQYYSDDEIVDSLLVMDNLLLDTLSTGNRTKWIRVPGDVGSVTLRDLHTHGWQPVVFCVRAIDEASAVEPYLENGQNWFMAVHGNPQTPPLTVYAPGIGSHTFPDDGEIWDVEIPNTAPIRLCWTGRTSRGQINYGFDIPDPLDDSYHDPNGIGGWIGWGSWDCMYIPVTFPDSEDGMTHVISIRFRVRPDIPELERHYTILIRVVAATFDRTALLVDDARITYGHSGAVQDQVHDEFIERFIGRIHHYATDGLDYHTWYRPRGSIPEALNPTVNQSLTLGQLLRYSAILWSFNYTGGTTTGLWFTERETPRILGNRNLLSAYLAAGGKLFMFGGRQLAAMMTADYFGTVQIQYPKYPPQAGPDEADFTETSFIWNFLHARNLVVGIDPGDCYSHPPQDHQQWRDGLLSCSSHSPAYPDLFLDPAKHDAHVPADCPQSVPPPVGGIKDYEGVLFDDRYPPHYPQAGLDTLYTSVCYDWSGTPASTWHGAVVAQRYESTASDTLLARAQGRTILYLFQPFPFMEGPVVEAGTASINWLMTGSDY